MTCVLLNKLTDIFFIYNILVEIQPFDILQVCTLLLQALESLQVCTFTSTYLITRILIIPIFTITIIATIIIISTIQAELAHLGGLLPDLQRPATRLSVVIIIIALYSPS